MSYNEIRIVHFGIGHRHEQFHAKQQYKEIREAKTKNLVLEQQQQHLHVQDEGIHSNIYIDSLAISTASFDMARTHLVFKV